jgi:hypothetical protein
MYLLVWLGAQMKRINLDISLRAEVNSVRLKDPFIVISTYFIETGQH